MNLRTDDDHETRINGRSQVGNRPSSHTSSSATNTVTKFSGEGHRSDSASPLRLNPAACMTGERVEQTQEHQEEADPISSTTSIIETEIHQQPTVTDPPQTANSQPRYYCSATDVTQVNHVTSTSNLLRMQDIQNLPTVSSTQILQGDTNQEEYKKNIYKHPLFPMLAMLFEKCELATSQPDTPPSDTFESDFHTFIQRQERENKAIFSDDEELNALMIKAIQVFRIHLQELQKVNELCKDFCGRYIACLKGKIQSESFLQDGDDPDSSPPSSAETSPTGMQPQFGLNGCYGSPANGPLRGYGTPFHGGPSPDSYSPPGSALMGALDGSDLSKLGCGGHIGLSHHHSAAAVAAQQQKRGVLPKRATQIMKQWLFQHLVHPYPTEDEKRQIAGNTGLTLLQVNNWFINARRRILQPMLDAANPVSTASSTPSGGSGGIDSPSANSVPSSAKKKKSSGHRPNTSRFWPPSLGNAVMNAVSRPSLSASGGNPTTPVTGAGREDGDDIEDDIEEDEEEDESAEERDGDELSPRDRHKATPELSLDVEEDEKEDEQQRRSSSTSSAGAATVEAPPAELLDSSSNHVKEEPSEAFAGSNGNSCRRSPPPLTPYQATSPGQTPSAPPATSSAVAAAQALVAACDLSAASSVPSSNPSLLSLPHNLQSAASIAAAVYSSPCNNNSGAEMKAVPPPPLHLYPSAASSPSWPPHWQQQQQQTSSPPLAHSGGPHHFPPHYNQGYNPSYNQAAAAAAYYGLPTAPYVPYDRSMLGHHHY